MQSKAKTVKEYLAELPDDRRVIVEAIRKVILANLDKDYQECMQYGAIGYSVPHSVYPNGYHCDPKQPLSFAGLGSQKNHISLGIMCHYYGRDEDAWFRAEWAKTGKKLDMGKCCIRFRTLDDVPLELIGRAIKRVPAKKFVKCYETAVMAQGGAAAKRLVAARAKPTSKASAKRTPARKTAKK